MKHMTSRFAKAIVLGLVCAMGVPVGAKSNQALGEDTQNDTIKINQLGYLPNAAKQAVVGLGDETFKVVDSSQRIVFSGRSFVVRSCPYSGESVRIADFTPASKPGRYYLVTARGKSYPFTISDTLLKSLSYASLRAFYYNRASIAIDAEHGGRWSRPMGHPDTSVIVHQSAASKERPAGFRFSSPKGWYDAGDYNKYIVNSGISCYTMLLAYHQNAAYYQKQTLNIPESNNSLPDILDELLWNLRWMLTMQDPNDGGVYHKLTNKSFDGFVMPDKATEARYVVSKSTAATLDFAATMAYSYRVFSAHRKQLPGFADSCLAASKKAMQWAEQNPNLLYDQPSDVFTGKYDDTNLSDEWFWAKVELALATKEKSYLKGVSIADVKSATPTWNSVGMLGVCSLALSSKGEVDKLFQQQAARKLVALADSLCKVQQLSAYNISLTSFDWGSNSDVANQGIVKMLANKLNPNKKYVAGAYGELSYLLGCNPLGISYITGVGSKSPMNIHHRPSGADGIEEPVPGFLAGGPNLVVPTDCGPSPKRDVIHPAKSYEDSLCSYSTNEVAINWNAPLACLVGLIDAYYQSTNK